MAQKRDRSALSILKAAKAIGAASVKFPCGTVVDLASSESPAVIGNGAALNGGAEVDRWFEQHANQS